MTHKLPSISVILPAYNAEPTILDAVHSILEGTFEDLELVVVDDGSTDDTQNVLQSFPDIRVIHLPENRGVSYARNRGIEEAQGALICFLDSDDLWEEGKLEEQMKWMQGHPECQAVYTD